MNAHPPGPQLQPSSGRGRALRRCVGAALLGLLALLLVAEWTPLRVVGQSMEPTLHSGQWLRLRHLPALRVRLGELVGTRFGSALRRGELVVFRAPPGAQGRSWFVKRLVALPGERVALRGGVLFVDGRAQPARYAYRGTPGIADPYADDFPEVLVLDGRIVALEGHPPTALPERLAGVLERLEPLPAEVIARSRREATPYVATLVLGPDEGFVLGDDRSPGASEDSRAFGPLPLRRLLGVATPLTAPEGGAARR